MAESVIFWKFKTNFEW